MLRIYRAELRDSWPAWLSVSLTFIMVNAALALTIIVGFTGLAAMAAGRLSFENSAAWTIGQALVLLAIVLVALPVVGSATSLVVASRRGGLARLALAGATPAQVRGAISAQLAVVSLLCAPMGDALAVFATSPWLALMDYQARNEPGWVSLPPNFAPLPIIAANLICSLLVVWAGSRQARVASEIPPVEALRQSQAPERRTRLKPGGWAVAILGAGLVAGSFLSVQVQLEHRYKETVSNLLILGFMQVYLWGGLLATLAPVLVGPLTRCWTALVPTSSGSWQLARATVSARVDRLYKSVVPVMFTFALGVGSLSVVDSMIATMAVSMGRLDLAVPMWDTFVLQFGLPLLIAFAGGVGSLLMMGRQRDAELALAGLAGATPAQRVAMPALEALIITVTAVLLAAVVIVPSLAFQAYSLSAAGLIWTPSLSVPMVIGTFVGGLLITTLATVLPTLPARRLPERRVIARLVTE